MFLGSAAIGTGFLLLAGLDAANLIIGLLMLLGGLLGVAYFVAALAVTPQPHATAEPGEIYPQVDRFITPLLLPVGIGLAIAAIIFLVSQILLVLPESVATVVALVIALGILLTCTAFATMRRVSRGLVYSAVALPALALVIAGGAASIRRFSESNKATGAVAAANGVNQAQTAVTEVTTDNKFSLTNITVPAGQPVTLTLRNDGQAIHNWHVLDVKSADGKDIKTELTPGGQTATVTFTINQPGQYKFQCDVHPTEMIGTINVVPAAGVNAANVSAPANSGDLNEVTTDNKFSQTDLTIKANQQVTLVLNNKGSAVHNWHVLGIQSTDGKDIKTELTPGGQQSRITFTIDKPGTYKFQCDVHPTEMTGQLTVQ